ncbi:MAG: 50S ribosomal protein L11 methyltransferase [Deltaproteobacteria bacterium]|nr:MAG: 50S ribosomal protein L11 methyltransferase [Deltaproteobacteria bacterium]
MPSTPIWMKCTLYAPPELLEVIAISLAEESGGGVEEVAGGACVYFKPEDKERIGKYLSELDVPGKEEVTWSWEKLEGEEWLDSWKKYFHPFSPSKRLWVTPTWEEAPAGEGMATLKIDPGRAFGTGGHETTKLVLGLIDDVLDRKPVSSMLDVGCGSGILSVAALLLGVGEVTAMDIDPDAVDVTGENAALNNVEERIYLYSGDLRGVEGSWPLVVANILYQIIMGLAPTLSEKTSPGGTLIISGLLSIEGEAALEIFGAHGFTLLERRELGEWCALALIKDA